MEAVGEIFKSKREELGLSISDVASKTNIRSYVLRGIEDEDFSLMPSVYIKSFIKSYAEFLKIPKEEIDEIIKSLISEGKIERPAARVKPIVTTARGNIPAKAASVKKKQALINGLVVAAILIALSALVYFTVFYTGADSGDNSVSGIAGNANDDTSELRDQTKNLISFFDKPDSLTLEAVATDTAWIRIDMDGKRIEETTLTPGQSRSWAAKEFFSLSCGNVGAVEFKRNGRKLPAFGATGRVVRKVKITKDSIINASKPWKSETGSRPKPKTETNDEAEGPKRIKPSKLEDFRKTDGTSDGF